MVARACCRCNSGHYFMGEFCPFDGWSSQASRELTQAVEELDANEAMITLESLREAGLGPTTLSRCIIIEFGSPDSVFEALWPEYYVVDGEVQPLLKMGRSFK